MPADIALNPVSYVVLYTVHQLGRATSYDMKQRVAQSVGFFWSFPHSQLYAEPARLAAAGLLHEEHEQGGRRRRHYRLTAAGLTALQQWVAEATGEQTELRDPGLLKLFMAGTVGHGDVARLAAEQARVHEERLAAYQAIRLAVGDLAGVWELRTLTLGERFEALCSAFWRDVEADAAGSAPP